VSEDFAHNVIVFGDFQGSGALEGTAVVGGNFNSSQMDFATLGLSEHQVFSLFVAGTLNLHCGDANGNFLHLGDINLGPAVEMGAYRTEPIAENNLYDFGSSRTYFSDICEKLPSVRTNSDVRVDGNILFLKGSQQQLEIFNVPCNQIQQVTILTFEEISSDNTVSIIINLVGTQCSLNVHNHDIRGITLNQPSGHIVWTMCSDQGTFTLSETLPGSFLGPNIDLISQGAFIQGQIIVNSVTGNIYGGSYKFRGCVPVEECLLVSQACEVTSPPLGCIDATRVADPETPCCTTWQCAEHCGECPTPVNNCIPNLEELVIVREAGEGEGDDLCCPTWGCVENTDFTESISDPVVRTCPSDQTHQMPVAQNLVTVTWDTPLFSLVQSVTLSPGWLDESCTESGDITTCNLPAGQHIISYIANGNKPGTVIGCLFEIHIKEDVPSLTCRSGGVIYENGDDVTDQCGQQCKCVDGELRYCYRVRKELIGMDERERAHYWASWKAVYAEGDGSLPRIIDNHVQFFSRGLHNNGAFLPWHRGYILQLENMLQAYDCTLTVPWWDQQIDTRVARANFWGPELHQCSGSGLTRNQGNRRAREVWGGTFGCEIFRLTNNRCLQRRLTGGSAASLARIQQDLFNRYDQPDHFDSFRNRLEHGPGLHDSIHCIVGGTMCSARSSNDPIFFSHHANIDRIWADWQEKGTAFKNYYTGRTGLNENMVTSPYTPRDVLDLHKQRVILADGETGPTTVAVVYENTEVHTALANILNNMNQAELQGIGSSGTVVVDSQWFHAMNMDQADIDVITEAAEIAQRQEVREIVALTIRNGVARGTGMPGLEEAVSKLAERLAVDGVGADDELNVQNVWSHLSSMLIEQNLVPSFMEIQEILVADDNGDVIDVVPTFVPIPCEASNLPVCADGRNFANECQAASLGFTATQPGNCPIQQLPEPLPEESDDGASLEYNHEMQELAECPATSPAPGSTCTLVGTRCNYGLVCCEEVPEVLATCTDASGVPVWSIVSQSWGNPSSCDNAPCGSPSDTEIEVDDRMNRQRQTNPPTPQPTRRPTPPSNPSTNLVPRYTQTNLFWDYSSPDYEATNQCPPSITNQRHYIQSLIKMEPSQGDCKALYAYRLSSNPSYSHKSMSSISCSLSRYYLLSTGCYIAK